MASLRRFLRQYFAIDTAQARAAFRSRKVFDRNLAAFSPRAGEAAGFPILKLQPMLLDRQAQAGQGSGAYFHQDLLVARRVFEARPAAHVDIGSRVDGFVAHVAVFMHVTVLDIRPLECDAPNITFRQADLMSPPADLIGACQSVSCLHALEHFGLGRYGDPLDPLGHLKGFAAVCQLVAPGGTLYLSGPIGAEQGVVFDAHRVWGLPTLLKLAGEHGMRVQRLSVVDDDGRLRDDVPLTDPGIASSFGLRFGCGIVEMVRE